MNVNFKKIMVGLLVLLILCPLGIILPHLMHSGNGWGEWKSDDIKKHAGYIPLKMEQQEKLWKAPIDEYSIGGKHSGVIHSSYYYLLSGLIGVVLIGLCTWLLKIYYKRHE